MNARTIIALILAGFVGVSIIYIIADESGKGEVPQSTEKTVVQDDESTSEETKSACAGCAEEGTCSEEKVASHTDRSNDEKVVTTVEHAKAEPPATAVKTIAYYFHGEVRCTTCRTIEAYTREVLDNDFKSVEFVDINLDEEKNEHFIDEFNLSSSSLVLVRLENGKQKNWKLLDKIWTLVQDEDSFKKYTRSEIGGFVKVSS